MKLAISILSVLFIATIGNAAPKTSAEFLVKLKPGQQLTGFKATKVGLGWYKISQSNFSTLSLNELRQNVAIASVQPNYPIGLMHDFKLKDPAKRAALKRLMKEKPALFEAEQAAEDNPDLPKLPKEKIGKDVLAYMQWGMQDIGLTPVWPTQGKTITVAVIDTGVDYTHEDLRTNIWINGKEIAGNGVDDDNNGYVDDIMGWDFVSNDNKPYDLTKIGYEMLIGGGNPGHGTHCAGNVGAVMNNSKGGMGVASNVRIMPLRFIGENGQGTTEAAIKAIQYAVDNGAQVLSNSWGSEGEDPNDETGNQALQDAITYAQSKGAIFVAAAGNGHFGLGYDNDNDPKPAYPASYEHDAIISVAALNNTDLLGSFSNWGATSVDLGAPGVRVFSTVPGSKYQDKIEIIVGGVDIGKLIGVELFWDGTSMATPHVAGAAALYWSKHPEKTWDQVKQAVLSSVTKIPALSGRSVSGGKLNVRDLQ